MKKPDTRREDSPAIITALLCVLVSLALMTQSCKHISHPQTHTYGK